MKTYVVVESEPDAALAGRLLEGRTEVAPVIVAAGGKSSAISLAQSLMVARRVPVAVILDADSIDAARLHEQERSYFELLEARALDLPFLLLLAVPSLETLVFEIPEPVAGKLGIYLSERDRIDAAYLPKDILERAIRKSNIPSLQRYFQMLPGEVIDQMAELPLAQRLIAFVRSPEGANSYSGTPTFQPA